MAAVNWIILTAGLIGLAAAVYGLATLAVNAVRRRTYWDIVLAVAVAAVVVAMLIAFGDSLLR